MPTPRLAPTPGQKIGAALSGALAVSGVVLGVVMWLELAVDPPGIRWPVFAVTATLLVVCQRTRRTWIQLGHGDSITPLPMLAYALVLLGSPTLAVTAGLAGGLVQTSARAQPSWQRGFTATRTAISVAAAGLVLFSFGVVGPITRFQGIPWQWAIATVLAGVMMLMLDTTMVAAEESLRRGTGFMPSLRRGFALRVTAVGSLLSLAPIWVIGIDSSLVVVPLLAITTMLVHESTRRALERSHEAHHDSLTGLANRRSFSDLVAANSGGAAAGAMLLMDLDGFKEVNDQLGHEIGDAVLVAFSQRLVDILPPGAGAARLGGDEFAALLVGRAAHDEIESVVAALHGQLTEPLDIRGFPVSIGVSIGVARYPDDGRSADELLRAADVAMYRSKRLGTNVERYEHDEGGIQTGRVGLLSELSSAVRDNQLRVDYQPQLRMSDGKVIAVEALVRWQHPTYGTIAPMDFIGLAEQTDLIGPITDTVLRVAAGGVVFVGIDDMRLVLNASVRNLHDGRFAKRTLAALAQTGLRPRNLEIEVTERALLTHADRSRDTIAELRAAGVRITIDGFGTGYASYQSLRALQVDRIKIDRDFVLRIMQDRRDRMIVESVVGLAHALDLEVIAEGVEADETWDLLAEMGCDAAQGFGIAMPMPLPQLRAWISQWQRAAELPAS